jgi:hypothetical protein
MSQFTFDDSLPTELHTSAVDVPESNFSRSQEASPIGSSLELPMFTFDDSLRTELHPCSVDVFVEDFNEEGLMNVWRIEVSNSCRFQEWVDVGRF